MSHYFEGGPPGCHLGSKLSGSSLPDLILDCVRQLDINNGRFVGGSGGLYVGELVYHI